MFLLQFAFGLLLAVEETQDGHVSKGVVGRIEVVGNRAVHAAADGA